MSGGRNIGDDRGFTLIELLVVVVIIGILAAIAIPAYVWAQASATDGAVQSDVQNLKKAVMVHETSVSAFGPVSSLSTDGYPGPSVHYTGTGSPSYATTSGPTSTVPTYGSGFCVAATSPTGTQYFATDRRGVTKVVSGTSLCS